MRPMILWATLIAGCGGSSEPRKDDRAGDTASPASSSGLDASGSWSGTCEDGVDAFPIEMDLVQIGTDLDGTGFMYAPTLLGTFSGSIAGSEVELAWTIDGPYTATYPTVAYALVLEGDTLSGAMTSGGTTSPATAFTLDCTLTRG